MFNCKDQRIKDVMSGLEAIRPIVTLLRKLKEEENELLSIISAINNIGIDVETLNEVNTEVISEELQSELAIIQKKYNERVVCMEESLSSTEKKLIATREEITQYIKYSNSFYYVTDEEIVSELLERAVQQECSDNEFYTILFLLTNESGEDRDGVDEKAIIYSERAKDSLRNYILKNFERYEFNDIVQMIKES